MPKPTKGPRFGGTPAHQRIILANMASQLFEHGRITTTEAKAKRVQPLAERLIAKAKRGDLHNRRIVLATITDKGVVHTLFTEIAPKLEGRDGGYTRITKIGPRKGDNAPMAVIEIVQESIADSKKANAKASAKPAAKEVKPAKAAKVEKAAPAVAAVEAVEGGIGADGGYRGETPPEGYDIKGNADSMKFHTPESPWYDRTIAEVWFNSADTAEAAGFVNAVKDADAEPEA